MTIIDELYKKIEQKIKTIEENYSPKEKKNLRMDTVFRQEQEYLYYYQNIQKEVYPELLKLRQKDKNIAQIFINRYIRENYKDVVILDVINSNFTTDNAIDIVLSEDIIHSFKKHTEIYKQKIYALTNGLSIIGDIKVDYYLRPFLNDNNARILVLLKNNFTLGMKTIANISNVEIQALIFDKQNNEHIYQLVLDNIVLFNSNELKNEKPTLSNFINTLFYYKDYNKTDEKMNIKVIYDAVKDSGLEKTIKAAIKARRY